MNRVGYYFLSKIHETQDLNPEYLEYLYQYYEAGSHVCNYNIQITKEDFQEVFNTIYNILGLRIDNQEFEKVMKHYLSLLIADAKDGVNVDINWLIDHIWYLCVGILDDIEIEKYKDCILFIQQVLIKKFNIEEKIIDKAKRKIFTRFMTI